MTQISKPYAHGPNRWRCRTKTESGWRWCASAATPEQALALAQRGNEPAQDAKPLDNLDNVEETPQHKVSSKSPSKGSAHRTEIIRIEGPFRHRTGWRCRLLSSAGRQWAAVGKTKPQALRLAEDAADKLAKQGQTTVRDALTAYLKHKDQEGARPATIEGSRGSVSALFLGMMDSPLWRITPRACQHQYDQLREAVDPRSGRTLSVATHRSYLGVSRTFFRWTVERGWLRDNPLERVRGVGRKRRGKPQLSLDEVRQLIDSCLGLASRVDEGATAVLMAVTMGLRASEILSRTPRDLDNGGTILRIEDNEELNFKTKNESSKRAPEIPSFLRPILARTAADKLPTDPLFPASIGG